MHQAYSFFFFLEDNHFSQIYIWRAKFCHESTSIPALTTQSLRWNLLTRPVFKLRFTSYVFPATDKFILHGCCFDFVTDQRKFAHV